MSNLGLFAKLRGTLLLFLVLLDAASAWWASGVPYIDSNGETQYCENYTVLTNNTNGRTTLDGGWYVVSGMVSIAGIGFSDDANIILADGATLTVDVGDYEGIHASKNIAIYGQRGQTGKLDVRGYYVGIKVFEGSITINGGTVFATGKSYGINVDDGDITLGWTDPKNDHITANSYFSLNGSVKIAEGKAFKDENGGIYFGTLTSEQIASIAGKTLIPAKSLASNNISIADISDQTYIGSAICTEISVTDGETALQLNTDYTVECSNNVNTGTATMTITGKGDYAGTVEKTFKIVPEIILVSGAVQVLKDQNGTRAEIDGEYKTNKDVVKITEDIEVKAVEFKRTFTEKAFSTITLPFGIDVNKVDGADFFQIIDIDVNIIDNGTKKDTIWGPVKISQVTDKIEANTPYLLEPTKTSLSFNIGKDEVVSLNTSKMNPYSFTKEGVKWDFRGTYNYFEFGTDSTQLIKKSYGFAAKNQDNGLKVGEFRWTSAESYILPMRGYLVYKRLEDGENGDGNAKPQMLNAPSWNFNSWNINSSIPETMEVEIVNEKGGRTVIGTINTCTGEIRLTPSPKYTYDLKGRHVNESRKAKGVYVEK